MGKRRTIEDWKLILAQFHASELTIIEFCKQHKLTVSNFYKWRKHIEQLDTRNIDLSAKLSSASDDWQAITVNSQLANAKQWDIELTLPGGVMLNMRATS